MALPQETIIKRIEKHVKQLEGLAYKGGDSRIQLLAANITGHIEEGCACADVPQNWEARVKRAWKEINSPAVDPQINAGKLMELGATLVRDEQSLPLFETLPKDVPMT
jgi:hypothetical protein